LPSKEEQAELVVRRAALMIEHIGFGEVIAEEEVEEDEDPKTVTISSENCLKSKLFAMRIEKLTAATQLREESLLTLLLKIEALTKNWDVRLRVLPTSHELIKVSFFKSNEEEIKKESDFFVRLTAGCRRAKGTIYINLIERCNRLGLRPI
jgi:hypothetical protein